jgi:murein DD-endopeptidase MepM/ murein hydrolase activator NlpD
VEEAARQFEAWFISSMLKEVREASSEEGGLFGSSEMRTYGELFDQEIAGRIAEGRGLGLASSIARSLAARGYAQAEAHPAQPPASGRSAVPAPAAVGAEALPAAGLANAWPLPSETKFRVSSDFGLRADPIHGGERTHHGIDLAAPQGTPILSVGDGVVTRSGWVPGYGRMVEVDHGQGVVARYAHGSRLDVEVGARVKRGMVLGAVGSSGRATGSHLHLEIRVDGRPVDPEPWLRSAGTEAGGGHDVP